MMKISRLGHANTLRASTIALLATAALGAAGVMPSFRGHAPGVATTSSEADVALPLAQPCADSSSTVAGASEVERHLACAGAADAIELLARCRIAQTKPIHIRMMNVVRKPSGAAAFGYFDHGRDQLLVTRLSGVRALIHDTPYGSIPDRAFYKSLVVHEVVHGVMHYKYTRQPSTHAAIEYPAYAIQIALLPSEARTAFLDGVGRETDGRVRPFNDVILGMNPYYFAARAYDHYAASADGCGILHALLDDKADFVDLLP